MPFPSEINIEAGMIVWRGVFDPGLMRDFTVEAIDMLGGEHVRPVSRHGGFDQWSWRADELLGEERPAISGVLKWLGQATMRHDVALNYQPPHVAQPFHKDAGHAIILHAGGDGAFDCSPTATSPEEADADKNVVTIYLGAGDVVGHLRQEYYHRGRNLGVLPRVTAAVSRLPDGVRL